jgi:5-enolpyruvylshikimate-3-phosphate synthase
MSLAVLATRFGGIIDGAQAAAKSMPDFFERLSTLGYEVISHDA